MKIILVCVLVAVAYVQAEINGDDFENYDFAINSAVQSN